MAICEQAITIIVIVENGILLVSIQFNLCFITPGLNAAFYEMLEGFFSRGIETHRILRWIHSTSFFAVEAYATLNLIDAETLQGQSSGNVYTDLGNAE
ncbi:hypothetical protein PoB_005396700 [Plakobranchus ocellatus]|uniref:Uncharacterized protein n=1 Tax=Plakobranchus ocellatus TaxID=259542 RepID=A0AAV4C7G1_9GAST|nr:hypothetical protein PoB_005396700 [Plakobranchus ocellatus]